MHGVLPDWDKYYLGETRRKIPLPTYSFEKTKYPLGGDVHKIVSEMMSVPTLSNKKDISNFVYVPSWKRSALFTTKSFTWFLIEINLDKSFSTTSVSSDIPFGNLP